MVRAGGDKMFEFSENLKRIRESRGISKTEIAKVLNIAVSTYSYYENGRDTAGDREPSYTNLIKIADFFGMSVDALLGRQVTDKLQKCISQWSTTGFYFEVEGDNVVLKNTTNIDAKPFFTSLKKLSPCAGDLISSFPKEDFVKLSTEVSKISTQQVRILLSKFSQVVFLRHLTCLPNRRSTKQLKKSN